MAQRLRQNSPVTIQLGPAVATTGLTTVSGLTAANVTSLRIIKHAATTAITVTGRTFSHVHKGNYLLSLVTTGTADTNTLGHFKVYVTATGAVKALPFWKEFEVIPQNVYDSMVSGGSKLNVGTLTSAAVVWTAGTRALTDKVGFALTSGQHDSIGTRVWVTTARTLTSAATTWTAAGRTLTSGSTVWAAATRSLTDKVGYALTTGQHTLIGDAHLKRDMSAVSGEAARSPLNAFRFLRNKWLVSGSTLRVKKEDDSTDAWTSALTTTSGAQPITTSDPA